MGNKKRIVVFVVVILFMFCFITFAGGTPQNQAIATRNVTFIDGYNNEEVSAQRVLVGEDAEVPTEPTHANMAFVGWYLENDRDVRVTDFTNITENITVVALYGTDRNGNGIVDTEDDTYTVRFVDTFNNTVIDTQTLLVGMDATAPVVPTHEGMTFAGWSRAYTNVRENIIVNTVWNTVTNVDNNPVINPDDNENNGNAGDNGNNENEATITTYTVTFVNYDGTVLRSEIVEAGKNATAPSEPSRTKTQEYTYEFAGWDVDFENIQNDLTVTAMFTEIKNKYTVTFVNYDGTVLNRESVEYGNAATAPVDPIREATQEYSYEFAGWDKDFTNIQEDLTVTATYTEKINEYTVTFVNYDGKVLKTDTVEYGNDATAPSNPTKPVSKKFTYIFAGWDKDFTNIQSDLVVTAKYTENLRYYTVTFVDENGDVLEKITTATYGSEVTPTVVPTKAADETYTYTFAGWDTNEYKNVKGNLTVTATYQKTYIDYEINYYDYDNQPFAKLTGHFGDATPVPEINPERTDYIFTGWEKFKQFISGNAKYVATYISAIPDVKVSQDINKYTDKNVVVTVTATPKGNRTISSYSFDGGVTWSADNTITISENKTLNIIVVDNKGTYSIAKEYKITNIDKSEPTTSITNLTNYKGENVIDVEDHSLINKKKVDIAEIKYNIDEDNIEKISYAQGEFLTVEAYLSNVAANGEVVLPNTNNGSFNVTVDGYYTIYVKDKAGHETVKVVKVRGITEKYKRTGAVGNETSKDDKVKFHYGTTIFGKRDIEVTAKNGATIKTVKYASQKDSKYDISYFQNHGTVVNNEFTITNSNMLYSIYVEYTYVENGNIITKSDIFYTDLY